MAGLVFIESEEETKLLQKGCFVAEVDLVVKLT